MAASVSLTTMPISTRARLRPPTDQATVTAEPLVISSHSIPPLRSTWDVLPQLRASAPAGNSESGSMLRKMGPVHTARPAQDPRVRQINYIVPRRDSAKIYK